MINKLILATIICVCCTTISYAQTKAKQIHSSHVNYGNDIDKPLTQNERSQIIEVYGNEAEDLIFSNAQRLKDLKHILRNRVQIIELPGKDLSSFRTLSQVPLFNDFNSNLKRDLMVNETNFNPLKYQFQFSSKKSIKVRIDNTQKLIIIKSQFE